MSKNGNSDGGSLFTGHLSKSGSWPRDDGRDDGVESTKGESFDDVDDGERGGLSEYLDAVNDNGDRYGGSAKRCRYPCNM